MCEVNMYVCMYVCVYVCMYVCKYIHTYIHTHLKPEEKGYQGRLKAIWDHNVHTYIEQLYIEHDIEQ